MKQPSIRQPWLEVELGVHAAKNAALWTGGFWEHLAVGTLRCAVRWAFPEMAAPSSRTLLTAAACKL